jgi:chitodextrinase
MKTKQLVLGVGLSLLGFMAHAQNGLEKLTVEKYYITNAADATQADAEIDQYNADNGTTLPTGALPAGSVTYRFYADLLPGYQLLSVYADGTKNQTLKFKTNGKFYNNVLGTVSPVPGTTKAQIKNNLLALDSYVSLGAVAGNQGGILKADDNGAANNVTSASNPTGVLLNNDPAIGIPLTTQDGMIAQTGVAGPGYAGFSTGNNEALNDATVLSNDFTLTDGSWFSTTGVVGPVAATNRVLIAQITTTDGTLQYALNILVKAPDGTGQFYVSSNPTGSDILEPTLAGNIGGNTAPTVAITAPADGSNFATGATVGIDASAADADGTVTSVEFFVDGTSIGVDNTAPYHADYTAAAGAHALTAKATDNGGLSTTSSVVNINVSNANVAPTVAITAPANGATFTTNDVVAITANAADSDGSVASVEFFVDGTSVGVDNTAPYEATYTAVAGAHALTAKATDNGGLSTTSAPVNITVNNANVAPTVAITAPANGATFTTNDAVAITADANDTDGTIASVEFFVDGTSVGVDNTAPFEATYTAAAGAHALTAKATDNGGLSTTSAPVNITVNNANVAPTVALTAPANGATYLTGASVAITADANDADGTIASVEFFVDGTSIGVDNTAPYEATYAAGIGAHALTAKATDNGGLSTTSAPVNITVNDPANVNPTATITAPANGSTYTTGDVVAITADANDTDGNVVSVEFFVDGTSIGIDNTAPYEASYTSVAGAHALTAKATDNKGGQGVSAPVNITVNNANVAPTVAITAPANGATYTTGAAVAITANAADSDGTVASVEFFVDGTSIGVDTVAPYEASYTAVAGAHALTAKATDNGGLSTTSAPVNITVGNANVAPTVAITAPSNGAVYNVGAAVAIAANAADSDGTIASVEFFVDGTSVGVDNTAPYEATYTAAAGAHALTAKATDNGGLSTTSAPVTITVVNPNGQPYTIGTITGVCTDPSFCLPILAVDTVKNVIGYDLVLNYNPAKVHATGNVTLNNALINPSYASYVVNNNAAAGQITIAVYLNATAPANAGFNGTGELVCVEFTKDPSLLAIDTVAFNVSSLQESYATGVATKLADAGKFINTKSTIYNGSLKFWTDNSPIKYNTANPSQYLITNIYGTDASCGNKSATAVQPDTLGIFHYNIVNGTHISIERDIAAATDVQPVINGFDASLGHKVLVNDLSFIPNIYQAIALDVNADGVISAGDISQINQRSVKTIAEFKQKWNYNSNGTSNGQPSKDWLFLDSTLLASPAYKISATYPSNDGVGYSKAKVPVVPFCLAVPVSNSTSCPIYAQTDYKGVLLGDVNGNYDAIPADGQLKREAAITAEGTVYINLDQAKIGYGYVDIPVSIMSNSKVTSLDFATKFNENVMSYEKVVSSASYLADALAHYNEADKTLRFTSNSSQALENDKTIVTLRFNTIGGTVNNSDLSVVRGLLNGNPAKIEVKGNIVTGITTTDKNISVVAYPNPANGILNVVSPERAMVELMDLQGRQVILSTMVNANQKQEISTENIAAGMYLLKVSNENFISTQRIVVDNIK